MTPIDLVDYTRSSKKIPTAALKAASSETTPPKTWKILAAFMMDFSIAFAITHTLATFLELSFSNFMMTRSLGQAFRAIPFDALTSSMFPLMFTSYFFFSYFFNHGQSFGMLKMKLRIEMPEMSFRSSLVWGVFSACVLMSAGLFYVFAYRWLQRKGWGEVKNHDHLYQLLMLEKTFSPVNLVEISQQHDSTQEAPEEQYLEAA